MEGKPAESVGEVLEEYVLLDLDEVSHEIDIPAGASYILSGLNTMHPILTINDSLQLVGEYQETLGTCIVFSECDRAPATVLHPETGPSETNLFRETCIIDEEKDPGKEVEPIASVQRILKFRRA